MIEYHIFVCSFQFLRTNFYFIVEINAQNQLTDLNFAQKLARCPCSCPCEPR